MSGPTTAFNPGADLRPTQETCLDDRIAYPAFVLVRYWVSHSATQCMNRSEAYPSAAVLIWRGSVRTKKSVSVEEKLRSALGVSLAISGVPQTKDGTIITGDNRAPTPPTPGSSRSTSGETDEKRPYGEVKEITADEARGGEAGDAGRGGKRRTTITIGSIPEKQDSGRNRASTVAAPGPLPRRTLQPLGPAMPTNAQEDEVSAAGGMELREIASQPRVAEAHQP